MTAVVFLSRSFHANVKYSVYILSKITNRFNEAVFTKSHIYFTYVTINSLK